jgi:hypothetical protein
LSCSIAIINLSILSPTLNVNPTLFAIPRKFYGGLQNYNVAITITLLSDFHPSFQASMTIFH